MNSLSGAAQISCVLFIFVVVLLTLESMARKRQRFHERSSGQNVVNPLPTRGSVALACIIICALPLVFGFVIPVSVLLSFIIKGFAVIDFMAIFTTTLTSLFLAVTASTLVMLVSVVMIIVSAYKSNNFQKALTFLSSCGYAFPGTILAVGVVVFVGWLNDLIYFHISYFAGGLIILLFAYTLRFLAVGNGAIRSGITKIHPSLIDAGRTMGFNFFKIIKKIIIPLIYTNILVGGILVFVDILKELPMTLLLRPFNFETLATYVYQYASDEMLEESSLAAIIIVLTGVGPVILLNSAIKKISKRKESIIKSDLLTSGVHN
ncbi:MAG: iron ABC transporter permease [Pelagibacteraceae bacterium]|nr:iron ABC transporter permease [Pelagibacteraceae bacterium]